MASVKLNVGKNIRKSFDASEMTATLSSIRVIGACLTCVINSFVIEAFMIAIHFFGTW